jgi:outer membrane protein OmpA-like peptidoglycan-associated protein
MLENGDLENYTGKLYKKGRFYLVDSWDVLTSTSADYFEEDNALALIGIPDNLYGTQEVFNGSHYAGINAFSYDPKNLRSYIYSELKSPLQKGQLYCVKYYVNLADRSRFAIANLGAYFSESKFKDVEDGNVFFEAQIRNDNQKVLKNTHQWEVVCNVLNATGKEEYFVIGNFDTDEETVKEKIIAPQDMQGAQVQMAYYYIDYISVSPVSRFSDCSCSARKERGPDIVYSKAETVDGTASDEEVIKNSTIYFGYLKKDMNSSAKSDLDRLAAIMEDNENYRVKITGHVDSEEAADLGDDEAAKDFSRDRAYAALDYLSDRGIEKSRFDVYGYGKMYPANSGSTPLSKAKNRRVEFGLISD